MESIYKVVKVSTDRTRNHKPAIQWQEEEIREKPRDSGWRSVIEH